MIDITFSNAKRLIFPSICLFILFMFAFLVTVFSIFITHHSSKTEAMAALQNAFVYLLNWNPIFFLIALISSLFSFQAIFFSIEQLGFFHSLKKSFLFSLKNKKFLIPIVFYNAIRYSLFVTPAIISLMLASYVGKYIYSAISLYINFIITASSLIYYQKKRVPAGDRKLILVSP